MSTTTKVSVETKELVRALSIAGRCVSSKPLVPIQGDVLLSYKEDGFVISASNTELWIDVPVTMKLVDGEFDRSCINYLMLKNAAEKLPQDSELLLTFVDGRLTVDYKKGKFTIATDPADDYPQPTEFTDSCLCKMFVHDRWLLSNLRSARICCAQDNLRPQLASVCMDVDRTSIKLVSSDGTVMFYNDTELKDTDITEANFESSFQVLLSTTSIDAICASISDSDDVEISINGTHVVVNSITSGVRISARLTEGKFPPYEQIIGNLGSKLIKVGVRDLTDALKRCGVFANDQTHLAVLNNTEECLHLTVDNLNYAANCGENIQKLYEENMDTDFRVGFNLERFISILNIVNGENVLLKVESEMRPIFINEDNEQSKLLLLLMPMKIN